MGSVREAGRPEPALGMTQREAVGREAGGGSGRGTRDPVADSGRCTVDAVTVLDFNPPIKVDKFIFHKKAIW